MIFHGPGDKTSRKQNFEFRPRERWRIPTGLLMFLLTLYENFISSATDSYKNKQCGRRVRPTRYAPASNPDLRLFDLETGVRVATSVQISAR